MVRQFGETLRILGRARLTTLATCLKLCILAFDLRAGHPQLSVFCMNPTVFTVATPLETAAVEALRAVNDPLTGQDWVSGRQLRALNVNNGVARVQITALGYPRVRVGPNTPRWSSRP